MRLKSVVKYDLSEVKNSILVFYGVMVAITILFSVSLISVSSSSHGVSYVGGAEMASAIFLFVVGLNSFRQNYLFLSTNGITRKAQFYGFLISSLIVAAIMAVIDTACGNVLTYFVVYKPLFGQIYDGWVTGISRPLYVFSAFVWSILLYIFSLVFGYLIRTLYYRMSKLLKIIVSIGVPALFFNILPIIDSIVTGGKVYRWFGRLFVSLAGLNNGCRPFIGIISLMAGTAVLAGLAYLLVRKAPVKE